METAYEIVHSLPGRVRLRLPQLHGNSVLASGLEYLAQRQPGVANARANPAAACLTIVFDPASFEPSKWLSQLDFGSIPDVQESLKTKSKSNSGFLSRLRKFTFELEAKVPPPVQFALGCGALLGAWWELPLAITRPLLLASIAPVLNRALQILFEEKRLSNDALDGTSCLILVAHGSYKPAALMTCLLSLGEWIRYATTRSCQRLFAHQLELNENSAWLIKGHRRLRTPVRELKNKDRIVVYPGELIPIAGTVCGGEGTVVPSTPEMDFEPRMLRSGDCVTPDLLLTEGKLYVQNEQGEICMLSDPIREKQTRRWIQRTKLHKNALHTGHKAILPMVSLATLIFVLTRDVHRALAIITFDFITGVRIAVPTAVLSSMYKAGMRGIVIRNAMSLEKLAEVDTIIFARGGGLTSLQPVVADIFVCQGFTLEQVTRLSAAVLQRYNHLGASSIISYAHLNKIPVPERTESSVIMNGVGVSATVEGHTVLVAGTRLVRQEAIDISEAHDFLENSREKGFTRACVVIDGKLAGVIAYQDPIREEAPGAVAALKNLGIKEFAVVTSGSNIAAEKIAELAGISDVYPGALAEDQANIVRGYKNRGLKVAVIGHDAANTLALEQADVAISLETGADIARHRSDVVLTSNNLFGLVEGIEIAREGMKLARQNLWANTLTNLSGLMLTFFDKADFVIATLINNGSVILATANGMRPLLDRPQEDRDVDEPSN